MNYSQAGKHLRAHLPKRVFLDLPITSTYFLLIILFLATAARRFYHLTHEGLWSDELWGVLACSQGSWWAMVQDLIHNDSHPPGYQTFLYGWMQLFGTSDFAIRLPTALAGIAAAAYAFELGRRHFSLLVGIIAMSIVAGSYQAIYYSKEARAYAPLMFLAPACASYFIELFVGKNPRAHSLWAFWLSSIGLIYAHYVGFVFMGAMILLWIFFWLHDGRNTVQFQLAIKAFAPALLLYLPWLPIMYHHMAHAPEEWSTPMPDGPVLWQTLRFLLGPDNARLFLSLFCIASVFILRAKRFFNHEKLGITASYQTYKHRAFACLLWLTLFPILVFYFKSQWSQSVYTLRHFTYAIPLLAVMAACLPALLIRQIKDKKLRTIGLAIYLLLLFGLDMRANVAFKLYDDYRKEDYRGAADIIRHDRKFMQLQTGTMLLSNHPFFDHYLSTFGIQPKADLYLEKPENIADIESFLLKKPAQYFYYLEVATQGISPVMAALDTRFEAICFSYLNKVKVAQFTTNPAKKDRPAIKTLHDCPLKRSVSPTSGS